VHQPNPALTMQKCHNWFAVLTVLSILVNHFDIVNSAKIAPATDKNALSNEYDSSSSDSFTLPETEIRVDFVYSNDSFNKIEDDALQFIGKYKEEVELACHLTSNKEAFTRWKYHGIEVIAD